MLEIEQQHTQWCDKVSVLTVARRQSCYVFNSSSFSTFFLLILTVMSKMVLTAATATLITKKTIEERSEEYKHTFYNKVKH